MTMMHTLNVVLDAQAATLQRLLGVVRRRGFDVLELDISRTSNDQEFEGRLRLRGTRSIESLLRHIDNIEEVQQIALVHSVSVRAA